MDDDLDADMIGISADDELESTRSGALNIHIGEEALPEDYDTPAAPADDVPEDASEPSFSIDHPSRDTDQDPMEIYQDGDKLRYV